MNPSKTYTLRLKPISEITEEERASELLASNCNDFLVGYLRKNGDCESDDQCLCSVTHYAVLPKD